MIPIIDVGSLFEARLDASQSVDQALFAAARSTGFLLIRELPPEVPLGPAARARLLRIFELDEDARRRLYRQKFAPQNPNIYRGWFPVQPGNPTAKEGIDIGADVAHGAAAAPTGDPLLEPTPLPPEELLPGWRTAVVTYYRAMEHLSGVLMRSLARSLELRADYFDAAFDRGLSTLRLIRYPPRDPLEPAAASDPAMWVELGTTRHVLAGAPHTDSGFLTLLAQDGIAGLQARAHDGQWIDVPPLEGTLVVNFGQVLEQWSAGRIRATEHRVLGSALPRCSIPFFYEARADAIIAPLPLDDPQRFAPFQYGDFLWQRVTSFVEFHGMEALRRRGAQYSP